jgi:carbon monoxide dehydrogenase subunit G
MEVKLDKRYPLEVDIEQAWAVLSDIRATAACMPGAAITEQVDDTHYKGTVRTKVGPAHMQFGGDIEVKALDAATRSMQMMGKGADKSGSSASMDLAARLEAGETPGSSVLVGTATVVVSGKLAQFGNRLLVPVSDAMLAQFADNFRAAAAAVPAPASLPAVVEAPADATAAPAAEGALVSHPATVPAPVARPAPAPVKELNALALMWTVFKNWLAGLFGRKA